MGGPIFGSWTVGDIHLVTQTIGDKHMVTKTLCDIGQMVPKTFGDEKNWWPLHMVTEIKIALSGALK